MSKYDDKLARVDERINQTEAAVEKLQNELHSASGGLDELKSKVAAAEQSINAQMSNSSLPNQLNIVLHRLPNTNNENIVTKVNNVLKEGLKLRNVSVETAERKKSYKQSVPGVVVATLRSAEDKKAVMVNKRKLAASLIYKEVIITHDKSHQQRIQEANLRTLAAVIGDNKLAVKGSRLVRGTNENSQPSQQGSGSGRRGNPSNHTRSRSLNGRHGNSADNSPGGRRR